ncbi:hypothetical protein ASE07_22740 [Noviherbaspirillum sp. Root189]|nr:hypothetical protein ASE07_22740 [Noviherbaspirillum sp. Root189]
MTAWFGYGHLKKTWDAGQGGGHVIRISGGVAREAVRTDGSLQRSPSLREAGEVSGGQLRATGIRKQIPERGAGQNMVRNKQRSHR